MAIKVSELRLENIISYNGEPLPIFNIDRGCRCFYTINDIQINRNTGCTIQGGEDVFSSIPLTERWLKRFGFEMRLINGVIPEYYIFCTPPSYKRQFALRFRFGMSIKTPKGMCDEQQWSPWMDSGNAHNFNIQYIHQLQNLYFTLTGEELQIKEA